MSFEVINNTDITPDTLKSAMTKINNNFAKLSFLGCLDLTAETDTTIINANTETVIGGTFSDLTYSNGFTTSAAGLITKTALSTDIAIGHGIADIAVNKACTITFYARFYDGSIYTFQGATPHTFTAQAKTETISTVIPLTFKTGDTMQIYVKSSEANTVLTVKTLRFILGS